MEISILKVDGTNHADDPVRPELLEVSP